MPIFRKPSTGRILAIVVALLALTAVGSGASVGASSTLQQSARFLSPPYYGTSEVTSVFDHELPLYGSNDGNSWTMHYTGVKDGPGARSSYDQHRGIDYWLRYEPVRAAASGAVAQAGWANPADHRASYGLHVRIDHADGFRTIYGHLSALRVQQGDTIPFLANEFQRIIGISGNTGLCYGWEGSGPSGRCTDNDPPSCGAHMHFQLEHNGRVENPYGWVGPFADPWAQRPDGATSVDRWLSHPSITNSDVFPADPPLAFPAIVLDEPGYVTVDDGDTGFAENPAGCWTASNPAGWDGDYRHRPVPGGDCTATWSFPQDQPAGYHHVFVHVPNDDVALSVRNATVDAARYTVGHTVSPSQPQGKQSDVAVVNQWAYPNRYHTSRWVYVGTYYFDSNAFGTDYVRLESQVLDSAGTLAADAVRFAPAVYPVPQQTYLPLTMKQWPPIPATPVLNLIDNPSGGPDYTISWSTADLADTYTLQEASDANFVGAVTRYSGPQTWLDVSGRPPGAYYYRVKAVNAWAESGWSNVQSVTVLTPVGWQAVAVQDFEGTSLAPWIVWDDNGATGGEYTWAGQTCRPYAGSYSGWGVGGGAQGTALSCGSDYPHNANSWMIYGPFDLRAAIAGELKFELWLYTESYTDPLFYSASIDGTSFYGYIVTGNSQGWVDKTLGLSNIPTLGSLMGQSQVWVALVFSSNGSIAYPEGAYVDDVVVRRCFQEPCSSDGSGALDAFPGMWQAPAERQLYSPVPDSLDAQPRP
jgi:murein DD-endopeptidase MepM/ murein hydrolase activator NlpD